MALVAGAAIGILALPTAGLANKPGREVTPATVDVIVDSCGLPVQVHYEATENAFDFGDRLGFTYSKAKATLTNVDTGESIRIAVPGPESVRFNDDGTVAVSSSGPWLWLRRHPITSEPGIWLTDGLIVTLNENRVVISAEQQGSSRNLCAALS
jgi:hypothetical protein